MTQIMHWLQAQLTNTHEPGMWVAISAGLYLLAQWSGWMAERVGTTRVLAWPGIPVASWFLVSLTQLMVPLVALQAGAVSPRFLGVSEIDWRITLSSGMVLAVVTGLVMVVGLRAYRHEQPTATGQVLNLWPRLADVALLQWQVAFCRAAAIAWFLPVSPDRAVYWGSWLALPMVVAAGCLLNPLFHVRLRRLDRSTHPVLDSLAIIVTTALFTFTLNLWLCLAVHLVVAMADAARSQSSQPSTTSS